jgi:CheY-like chemotaxis protein
MRDVVLVVDDDDECRQALCAFLEDEGYVTWGVSNGREALEVARLWRPAAIITDLEMPVMNGWALLDALEADPDLADVPRFVTSACIYGAARDLPVFPKPFDPDEVISAVRTKGRRPAAVASH